MQGDFADGVALPNACPPPMITISSTLSTIEGDGRSDIGQRPNRNERDWLGSCTQCLDQPFDGTLSLCDGGRFGEIELGRVNFSAIAVVLNARLWHADRSKR